MNKTMKIIKTTVKLQSVSSYSRFTTLSSLLMTKGPNSNSEKQMFKNLYKYEKKDKDGFKIKLAGILKLHEKPESSLWTSEDSKRKMKWALFLRDYIQEIEEKYCVGLKIELDLEYLPEKEKCKELTRRKWLCMLKKRQKDNSMKVVDGPVHPLDKMLLADLRWRDPPGDYTIKDFADEVAELKSIICDQIMTAKGVTSPKVFEILGRRDFGRTIETLWGSQDKHSWWY